MKLLPFCCGLLLALAACGDAWDGNAVYTPPPGKGGQLCAEQCHKSRGYCRWSCELDYRGCYIDIQAVAQREYETYAEARLRQNLPVDKSPHDFEHLADCERDKKSCQADCDRPYNACYSSCGGIVTP